MKRGLGLYKILGEKQVFAHERGFEPQIAQISRIKKPWQFGFKIPESCLINF